MTNAATLGSFGDVSGSPLVFRNKIINGGFDIWQRGTSQTSSGYGSDDRWFNENLGSTKTASRQTFTLGQTDVPANPKYFSRTVVTSVAGVANYASKKQSIEGVTTFAGQSATLSFWAKADAAKNIAVEFVQAFGTGGSPSATITSIGVTTFALTTTLQRFTVTISIPSISGKTLGTNADDCLVANFWFDAGSNYNARTNSLGQQSGTFDIANVQLEAGSSPTPFEQRPIGMELDLCRRYFESGTCVGPASSVLIVIPYYPKRIISINSVTTTARTTSNLWNISEAYFGIGISTISYTGVGTLSEAADGIGIVYANGIIVRTPTALATFNRISFAFSAEL